jgi:hypothetical protein
MPVSASPYAMRKHKDSHVDHGLTEAQMQFLLQRFADRTAFFIETLTLPRELETIPCGLYGPLVGDPAIREEEVSYATRGSRTWLSRLIALPPRQQHEVTVIAGPHEEKCDPAHHWPRQCVLCEGTGSIKHACILYTAFGGPLAPQEPGDPGCKDPVASANFWREHALAR